jgi:hypothetical protein
MDTVTNGRVARQLAEIGIPVFPCQATGRRAKQPLTTVGHRAATANADQIRDWWTRWPTALVGVPTGPESGLWVLDVDGEIGRQSLNASLARLAIEQIADLTCCVSRTPGGGLHLIFRLQPGESPRNRASDIGEGLDTRGVKEDGTSAGYFIAPGSTLLDGRRYELVDVTTLEPIEAPVHSFENAVPAPRKLLRLATFNAAERTMIAASPELRQAIQDAPPAEWPGIVEQHRATRRAALAAPVRTPGRPAPGTPEPERQLRYVAAILDRELRKLAGMQPGSGRNDAAFRLVCRVGRWVHHGIIPQDQLIAAVLDACGRNGLVHDDGRKAVLDTIASGLTRAAHDALPTLEARHG